LRKIAIMGKCSNSRADAPIELGDWEVWALAWDLLPRADRQFEMHDYWRNFLGGGEAAAEHKKWLQEMRVPVYMLKVEPDIPMSVEYPMEEVKKVFGATCYGTAYLESSIAYMMALAILEGADQIGIWGCDLATGGEYAYQRPNMEYFIGYARGRGIPVYVPPQNTLLSPCRKVPYGITDPDAGKPAERPSWMPEKCTSKPQTFPTGLQSLKAITRSSPITL
jgi:hypothetical protein